ncbi:hypothetical protein BGZ60DRAFT_406712 [Tricladium varicosporioides]|nr:hypothetical protein BGZ60DRAFT_406712 [Hymenoscyphus varicosporioides]
MFSSIVFSFLALLLTFSTALLPVRTLHAFPPGTFLENLVIRPSGSILVVDDSAANIYSLPPPTSKTPNDTPATLIHAFPNATGVSSISESETADVYFAITGSFNFSTFTPVPKSYALHRVDLRACSGNQGKEEKAVVDKIAGLESMRMPNGIFAIPHTPYVLIADSLTGTIQKFDTEKKVLSTYLDHPLLKPSGTSLQAGVNGIKISRGFLYFSNTNQEIVARVKISGREATPSGEVEVLATGTLADDFIVNSNNGDLYIAQNGMNSLGFLSAKGKGNNTVPVTIAGGGNSTDLLGPTAVVWAKGMEGRRLIVSTTGGVRQYLSGNFVADGTVAVVDVGGRR